MRPKLKSTVVLCPSDDSYLAYDIDAQRLHRLNPLTALIVEFADGNRDQEELVQEIAPMLDNPNIETCSDWVTQATAEGILIDAQNTSSPPAPTADSLHSLATKLRRENCVLSAFVCQQRALAMAPRDPKKLLQFAELACLVGHPDEARDACDRYREVCDDDSSLLRLLSLLNEDQPHTKVADRCTEQLRGTAPSLNPCGEHAPNLLFAAVMRAMGSRRDLSVLDVGCRSGQCLQRIARQLVGIDFSTRMIARARERDVYDHLELTEVAQWFRRKPTEQFDLIVLCDELTYFGDLTSVLVDAARYLAPGGHLGFIVEKSDTAPIQLTDQGRYRHHQDYVKEVAEDLGFRIVSMTEEFLREERGRPVTGWVVVLAEQE